MSQGVAFPSDQVLLLSAIGPMSDDLFDFPFWFAINKVWQGFQEVQAVLLCFIVGGQEGCVEDVVDLPSAWELKTICYV